VSRTVNQAVVHPFGRKFKVTGKGILSAGYPVRWDLLWRFAAIATLTLFGMVIHTSSFSPYHGRPGYSLTVFWSLLNALLLFFAAVVWVEPPKRRLDECFSTVEPATVILEDGSELPFAKTVGGVWLGPLRWSVIEARATTKGRDSGTGAHRRSV